MGKQRQGWERLLMGSGQSRWYRALYQEAVDDSLHKEAVQEGREEASAQVSARFYRALYGVALKINSSLDPQEVLKSIAESTTKAVSAKACSIMLLTEDKKQLTHGVSYGLSEKYLSKGPVYVDQSMGEALKGRSIAVEDVATDPRIQYSAEAVQEGIASILSVPIRLRDEVIGVMRVYTGAKREFEPPEIEFVEGIATLGAIAIENARVHYTLAEAYETLRQQKIPWAESFTKPTWR